MAGRRGKLTSEAELIGNGRAAFLAALMTTYPHLRTYITDSSLLLEGLFKGLYGDGWEDILTTENVGIIFKSCFINDLSDQEWDDNSFRVFTLIRANGLTWLEEGGFSDFVEFRSWMLFAFSDMIFTSGSVGDFNNYFYRRLLRPNSDDPILNQEPEIDAETGEKIVFRIPDPRKEREPLPPKLPHYHGEGSEAYKKKCNVIINKYLSELEKRSVSSGKVYAKEKPNLETHMRWFIWKVREGLSYDQIKTKESALHGSADTPGKSAIHEAVAGPEGAAALLGVRLNQVD